MSIAVPADSQEPRPHWPRPNLQGKLEDLREKVEGYKASLRALIPDLERRVASQEREVASVRKLVEGGLADKRELTSREAQLARMKEDLAARQKELAAADDIVAGALASEGRLVGRPGWNKNEQVLIGNLNAPAGRESVGTPGKPSLTSILNAGSHIRGKGEFERTDTYFTRMVSPIPDGRQMFILGPESESFWANYDADAEAFAVGLRIFDCPHFCSGWIVAVSSTKEAVSHYVGSNAFNVRRRIERRVRRIDGVRILPSYAGEQGFKVGRVACFAYPAPPSGAKALKPALRIAVVGRFVRDGSIDPFQSGVDASGATIDDPREIVITLRSVAFEVEELVLMDVRSGSALARTYL